jgi:hypothetical protein
MESELKKAALDCAVEWARKYSNHRGQTGDIVPGTRMLMEWARKRLAGEEWMPKISPRKAALAPERGEHQPGTMDDETRRELVESGASLIATERARQIKVEGWTSEHDDEHRGCQLADAARGYLLAGTLLQRGIGMKDYRLQLAPGWPWGAEWWKPSPDPIRNYVKAGALIAAEIDRLKRTRLPAKQQDAAVEAVTVEPETDNAAVPNWVVYLKGAFQIRLYKVRDAERYAAGLRKELADAK